MMCVRGYSSSVPNAIKLDEKLGAASKQSPPDGLYDKSSTGKHRYYLFCTIIVHFTGVLLYIYTSGTTGLPKPAVIKHTKYAHVVQAVCIIKYSYI